MLLFSTCCFVPFGAVFLVSETVQISLSSNRGRDLLQDPRNSVVVADQDVSKAEQILAEYAGGKARVGRDATGRLQDARAVAFNTNSKESLDSLVKDADLVVSLVPWTYHPMVMEACIEHNTHCVTASYVTPGIRAFNDRAKAKHLTFINELGLDPGIDIMSTLQMLDKIRKAGGVVRGYQSFCGALPEPESARNTMGYKFSWSPRGVLLAAKRPSKFLWKGEEVTVPGDILYETARPFRPFRSLALQWVPNGDATSYKSVYGFGDELETCVRATLRYDGFAQSVRGLRELGLLEPDNKSPGGDWRELLAKSVGASGASGAELRQGVENFLRGALTAKRAQAQQLGDFGADVSLPPLDDEIETALAALKELRLTDDSPIPHTESGQVIDALAETMQHRLHYHPHENDFVLMYHRFDVEYPRGRRAVHESSLAMRGTDAGSATAMTVGLPVGIAAQQVLDGSITARGVIRPVTPDVYDPIMQELRRNGVHVQEDEYDA
eukprot:Hpha_TRINITY_DN16223_c2_g6::TRINITY_DN16223_c2_g6_i1::g.13284::m.13284/K00293/LYS9; saccharopine dehydrogenase (NADP+, L-glutamate forming)